MTIDEKKALDMMLGGMGCGQVVMSEFYEELGLDKDFALNIVQGFEGGSFAASDCGALEAGRVILSIKYGGRGDEDKVELVKRIFELNSKFKEAMSSFNCKELLGRDVMEEGAMAKLIEENKIQTTCARAMVSVIDILIEILDNDKTNN